MLKLKDVAIAPETPKPVEAFTISGKVELFGIRFLGPAWVILNIKDVVIKVGPVFGGKFKSEFPEGLDEGSYELKLGLYLGPAMSRDTRIIPPFPALDTYETTFTVSAIPIEETTIAATIGYERA